MTNGLYVDTMYSLHTIINKYNDFKFYSDYLSGDSTFGGTVTENPAWVEPTTIVYFCLMGNMRIINDCT